MPAVLAAIARPLVQFATTAAIAYLVQAVLVPILERIVAGVAAHYNIPPDDAKVIVANQVIETGSFLVGGAAALKTRLPLKIADYLGLSASGFTKRKVSEKAAAAMAAEAKNPAAAGKAKSVISSFLIGENIWRAVIIMMTVQGVGDWFVFGRPQLQSYIDAILGKNTLELPASNDAPQPFSKGTWEAYVKGVEDAKIVGIEGGAVQATLLYSRDTLVNLVWWGYSEVLKEGKSPTETAVRNKIYPHLRFADGSSGYAAPVVNTPSSSGSSGVTPSKAPTQIQVYTGVVANGTLGTPSEFIARPDDMINDSNELKAAAKNNLAAFITALPGRFFYEVALVNSIKTLAGFTQKGAAVRVVSGYNKDGSARYKTVYNKFAQMKVGVIASTGKPVILDTINLGPVNVVDFQPTPTDLQNIAGTISSELFTNNIGDIKQINTPESVVVNNNEASPPPPPGQPPVESQPAPTATTRYRVSTGGIGLNLRSDNSLQASIIGKIPDGELLVLDPNTPDYKQDGYTWHITTYNGIVGFVAREYLTAEAYVAPNASKPPSGASSSPANTSTSETAPKKPTDEPKVQTDSLGLTKNQRKQYDSLVKVGASKSAALKAAKLVPK